MFLDGGFPVNVLNAIKQVPEVCRIYCATANPLQLVMAKTAENKKGIMGVIDGYVEPSNSSTAMSTVCILCT